MGKTMATMTKKKWNAQCAKLHSHRRGKLTRAEKLIAFVDSHKLELDVVERKLAFGLLRCWLRDSRLTCYQWKALGNLQQQIKRRIANET